MHRLRLTVCTLSIFESWTGLAVSTIHAMGVFLSKFLALALVLFGCSAVPLPELPPTPLAAPFQSVYLFEFEGGRCSAVGTDVGFVTAAHCPGPGSLEAIDGSRYSVPAVQTAPGQDI